MQSVRYRVNSKIMQIDTKLSSLLQQLRDGSLWEHLTAVRLEIIARHFLRNYITEKIRWESKRLRAVIRESAATNCFLFALYAASLITIIRGSSQIRKTDCLMIAESNYFRWFASLRNPCNGVTKCRFCGDFASTRLVFRRERFLHTAFVLYRWPNYRKLLISLICICFC